MGVLRSLPRILQIKIAYSTSKYSKVRAHVHIASHSFQVWSEELSEATDGCHHVADITTHLCNSSTPFKQHGPRELPPCLPLTRLQRFPCLHSIKSIVCLHNIQAWCYFHFGSLTSLLLKNLFGEVAGEGLSPLKMANS